MPDREWPANRARAWLLRKAAEMVSDGPACFILADGAICKGGDETEASFRELLEHALGVDGMAADRAVAEVYGDVLARERSPRSLAELRPAAEVADEMVSQDEYDPARSCLSDDEDYVPLEPQTDATDGRGIAEETRAIIVRLIERERKAAFEAGVRSVR